MVLVCLNSAPKSECIDHTQNQVPTIQKEIPSNSILIIMNLIKQHSAWMPKNDENMKQP